jgi:4-amino-4-deoxy-L-arabinose transferase-like glycosyltransferase
VPRPLVLVLLVVAALGIAWNLVVPFNQAPDEFAHMGYTQHFAETGSLPGKDPKAGPISTEEAAALEASNGLRTPGLADVDMTWSPRTFDAWRAADAHDAGAARRDGGGPNPASSNPPLYYLTAAPAYLLGSSGDFFTRVALVRLVSLAWLLGAVVGAWLLAGEVFRRDRLLQTTVAGVVGLAPMEQFIGNSVNPDPAVFATWAFALWLGVRLLRRGLTPGRAGALFLAVGLACVVKATSYALVPGALVVLATAVWRVRRPSRRAGAARVAAHRLPAAPEVARRRVLVAVAPGAQQQQDDHRRGDRGQRAAASSSRSPRPPPRWR